MSLPPISVVIPTYNRADLVNRAVCSVLKQAGETDEIIVVDDGSTDGTASALAHFGDRVRVLRIAHGGAGGARNAGVRQARHDLIAFLDSDDEWIPGKLQLQRTFMHARPDVLFCATDFLIAADGRMYSGLRRWRGEAKPWDAIIGPAVPSSTFGPLPPGWCDFNVHVGDFSAAILREICICTITVMVRRDAAGDALRFAVDLPMYEDWECFARLARKRLGAHFDCHTAVNHGHGGPRLTDTDDLPRIDARLRVIERVWGDLASTPGEGDKYREAHLEQRRLRVRALLAQGRTAEARAEICHTSGVPRAYRLLSRFPSLLVAAGVGLRRRLLSSKGYLPDVADPARGPDLALISDAHPAAGSRET
jgi:glycosyltransferase involved in cell wall biosynthesis